MAVAAGALNIYLFISFVSAAAREVLCRAKTNAVTHRISYQRVRRMQESPTTNGSLDVARDVGAPAGSGSQLAMDAEA